VFALVAFQRLGFTPRWVALLPLLILLAAIAVVDVTTKMIPDALTLPGIAYSLALAGLATGGPVLLEAAIGVLVGGGVLLLLAVVTRGGIGGGDIKLVAMLGGALGWRGAMITFALAQLGGGLVVLYLLRMGHAERRKTLPIGALIAVIGATWLALAP
jgi:prepilin signal peptidase PulO-like enzyme (type II secretory pathway)